MRNLSTLHPSKNNGPSPTGAINGDKRVWERDLRMVEW